MPNDLMSAVQHANRVCDWQENMTSDEIPPNWMWSFEDELTIWFERVDCDRKARYGSGGSSHDDTDGPMTGNELAKGRGR